MVNYYLYGRGKDGYTSYNPAYAKEDEEHYFRRMAGEANSYLPEQPEKRFFFHVRTKDNGFCSIFGKSSLVKTMDSRFSSDRDTVFTFQYLLSGEEREEVLQDSALLTQYSLFPDKMDQVCRTREGTPDVSMSNAVLDPEYFFAHTSAAEEEDPAYDLEELLHAFGLEGQRLREFLYTFLLFHTREKVYLLLPDKTREATDMAYALMRSVLSVLPAAIAGRTGFVTCVRKPEHENADFVPYEMRYLFLAHTEENLRICQTSRSAYIFAPGCRSAVQIPEEMQEITERLAEMLLSGSRERRNKNLWGAMNRYLKREAELPVSAREYRALDDWCSYQLALAGLDPRPLSAPELWANIDLLRSMVQERAMLWNDLLEQDLGVYVCNVIDCGYVEEENDYQRIIREYESDPSLRRAVENYFCRMATDDALLEHYLTLLAPCPALKRNVYERFMDTIVEKLASGSLEEGLYGIVPGIYEEHPEHQKLIEDFFVSRIDGEASMQHLQQLITASGAGHGAGLTIWKKVEAAVYLRSENYSFVLLLEKKRIGIILGNSTLGLELVMRNFWERIRAVYSLNRQLLTDGAYLAAVREQLSPVFQRWAEPAVMSGILAEAQDSILRYGLAEQYNEIFAQNSLSYLETNRNKICREGYEPELFSKWPFVSESNHCLTQIRRELQKQKDEGDRIALFEKKVREASVEEFFHFLSSRENEPVFDLAARSGRLENYIRTILRRTEQETEAPGKGNSARRYYDQLCAALILSFPDVMSQVMQSVMTCRYGGVRAMKYVYQHVCSQARSYRWTREMLQELRQRMAEEICSFFQSYKKSPEDRQQIRQEKVFLERLGLDCRDVLRL